MKNILFFLFLVPFHPAFSQYYYKDLVATQLTAKQFALLKSAGVKKVTLSSFDGSSVETAGFTADQAIDPVKHTLLSTTHTSVIGDSYLLSTYNEAGQLISTSDSAQNSVNKTSYTYDALGRLTLISNTSGSDNIANTEEHRYSYDANGQPSGMLRIRNGKDSSLISFVLDDKGKVGEEKTVRSTLPTASYYYYHDTKGNLSDVVRFNVRANRLLPDYMFEFNPEGQLKKMTLVPEGSNEYQVWYYQYGPDGLKKMDLVYNKQQQLMGKVEYAYSR